MTTIVGMHYRPGNGDTDKEAIVLASDITRTFFGTKDIGEVILKTKVHGSGAKIFADCPGGEFAIASTGLGVDRFKKEVLKSSSAKPEDHKSDEEKQRAQALDLRRGMDEIKDKGTADFPAFRNLNLDNCIGKDRKSFDPQNLTQLILASRYEQRLGLYVVWPMGLIEPCYAGWGAWGSGSEYATPFIETRLHLVSGLKDMIDIAVDSVYYAGSKDPNSGGVDLFVVDKDAITSHRDIFQKEGREYDSRVRAQIYEKHGLSPKSAESKTEDKGGK
jgi:hypothetical protein